MRILIVGLLSVLMVPCLCADSRAPGVNRKIEQMLNPILQAELGVRDAGDSKQAEFELGKQLQTLFQDNTPTADEALVTLLSFYIGEANGGDLLHQITIRGKRVLRLLEKHKDDQSVALEYKSYAKLMLPLQIKRRNFATAIDYVKRGKIWETD